MLGDDSRLDICDEAPPRIGKSDILIGALGFETRCPHVSRTLLARRTNCLAKYAVSFPDRHLLAYEKNKRDFSAMGFKIEAWEDAVENDALFKNVSAAIADAEREKVRVVIDISSMSRPMIATFFEWSLDWKMRGALPIFAYAPARFYGAPQHSTPMEIFGPISSGFRGWSTDAEKPISLVLGVGYEYERAFGAIEHIDPYQTFFLFPVGNSDFDKETEAAIAPIVRLTRRAKVLRYPLTSPGEAYLRLSSLVSKLVEVSRPVIVPLGPKPFMLLALSAAEAFDRLPSVWRVSTGTSETPSDRIEEGPIYYCSMR